MLRLGLVGGVIVLIVVLGGMGYLLLRLLPSGVTGSSFYLAVQHWQRQPLEILHQLRDRLSLLLLGVVISVRVVKLSPVFRPFCRQMRRTVSDQYS